MSGGKTRIELEREFISNYVGEIRFNAQKAMIESIVFGRKPMDYEYPNTMNEFKECIKLKELSPVHWQERLEEVLRLYRNHLIKQGKYHWEISFGEKSVSHCETR